MTNCLKDSLSACCVALLFRDPLQPEACISILSASPRCRPTSGRYGLQSEISRISDCCFLFLLLEVVYRCKASAHQLLLSWVTVLHLPLKQSSATHANWFI